MAYLSLEGVRKIYRSRDREVEAVKSLNLEIQKAELVTLLGPSGCGKTTLLKMLAGFEELTEGKILLSGKDISKVPPQHRNSSMVFQSYALFPHLSVRQNIEYGLRLRKLSKEERRLRFDRIVEIAGLSSYVDRKPHELSGGQQQRVALARALVVEPDLILFDEPLSNLDAQLRESMREDIRALQKRLELTALYVTHDQKEAMAISDRIVVMKDGRIEQIARPEELHFLPATKFVAEFVGASNCFSAEVKGSDFVWEGQKWPLLNGSSVSGSCRFVLRPELMRLAETGVEIDFTQATFLGEWIELKGRLPSGQKLVFRKKSLPGDRAENFLGRQNIQIDCSELPILSESGSDVQVMLKIGTFDTPSDIVSKSRNIHAS